MLDINESSQYFKNHSFPEAIRYFGNLQKLRISALRTHYLSENILSLSLSATLTHLELSYLEVDQSFIKLLPPTLKSLALPNNYTLTNHCMEYLPRTLTHLNLHYNNSIGDLCIPHLPITLIHLDLYYNNTLTRACIPHLPRSLTYLHLTYNENLTDSCISQLPKSLIHLNLGKSTSYRCMYSIFATMIEIYDFI